MTWLLVLVLDNGMPSIDLAFEIAPLESAPGRCTLPESGCAARTEALLGLEAVEGLALAVLELLALLALLELLEVLLGEGPRSLYASIPPLDSQKLLASKPIDG